MQWKAPSQTWNRQCPHCLKESGGRGPIRAKNPTHRWVAPGTGCDTAAIGTQGMALAVGAAGLPPGCASVGRGGTGVATCRKHGEGGSPDPTANSPDPTASSRNPEPSSRRWS